MQHGTEPAHYGPGWLDVATYLTELKATTGRGWCVCVAATGEPRGQRYLLFSVCEYRGGAPVVRDDLALVSDCWPRGPSRDVAATVFQLLFRFDRRLAEREELARQQAAL